MVLVLTAALLQSCSSVGNPSAVDEGTLSRLEPLRSTQQDVLSRMGEPTHPDSTTARVGTAEQVVQVWTYDFTHVDISPLTLIPVFGPFLGSSPVTTGSVAARFDQHGVLQHVARGPDFDPHLGYEGVDFQLLVD